MIEQLTNKLRVPGIFCLVCFVLVLLTNKLSFSLAPAAHDLHNLALKTPMGESFLTWHKDYLRQLVYQ